MPITTISLLSFSDMACSLSSLPPRQLRLLEGREHGRTIPLAVICRPEILQCSKAPNLMLANPLCCHAG
jgi:hypothetical protein